MTRASLLRSLFGAALALASLAPLAQLRTLPADAKRGTLSHVQGMTVRIGGQSMQLSAGAQVRDTNNMIVLPAAIPAGVLVKYQLDAQGNVHRAWMLTPQEAAQPDAKK